MSFQYGNGQTFNLSRDQDYRPAVMADGPYQKTYSHDPAGNVASLTDIGNTVLSYSYDSSGRLTGATDTAAGSFGLLGYSYDPNGNRQSETRNAGTLPYAYSPPNWLVQAGSDTRTRTVYGNTASTSAASFTYDGYNRLATSQTAAETTTYTYNALGERIKKINQNGLATSFHYGPGGELLYERDQAGNTKEYVWLEGRPLARIDNGTAIYYYHVDHLGTPQEMTDAAGATVWKADYEPFGRATVKASTVENNLRFPGQYYDRETGLHYNYFRDYDPTSGRYIEADPIGLDGGLNIYGYANQNPLTYIDPRGETAGAVVIGGGVLIVGGIVYMSGPEGKKAIKSIAQKIRELCTPEDKDPCDEQQELEEASCVKYLGHWSYHGCISRARIRGDMCRRKQPDPPPPWSDADVNGWAPPPAPRSK